MKRGQRKSTGEVTAFLSLTFLLFLSFIGSLMEGASIQMAKSYRRVDMNCAMESVFAEFQKELLEEFEVFGLEGSYENGEYSEERILDRLSFYGASGIDNEFQAVELLTDNQGAPFREQIHYYMEEKYGLEFLNELAANINIWQGKEESMTDLKIHGRNQENLLESLLTESQQQLPVENNPLSNISAIKQRPLVEMVLPEEKEFSRGSVDLTGFVSKRNLRTGYGDFSVEPENIYLSTIAFGEYLLDQFDSAVSENRSGVPRELACELEYILAGGNSDYYNINKVMEKLLLIRMVSNYSYILTDMEMRAEAEALSLSLCSLILLPEITEVVTQMLLLAWAFGESIMDLRTLFASGKVPLVKNKMSWQTSIDMLIKLGTPQDSQMGTQNETGLSYEEYLRILLFLEEKKAGAGTVTMRALDMLEQRLQKVHGCDWFRADACVTKLEVYSTCNLRRGIRYRFQTYWGYR